MSHHTTGRFTVDLKPQGDGLSADGVTLGRMDLHKRFEGGLQGQGQGQMLTALTPEQGSAGYVAIERFTGELDGRPGSFVLQHSGTMTRGEQQLSISVVPGSGTGALAGLQGRFTVKVVDGVHVYDFNYTLAP